MKIFSLFIISSLILFAINNSEFPFDKSKVKGYDGTNDLSKIVAPIVNQVWIASKKLSKGELKRLVLSKYQFKIVGYKRVYGLLIQIDENDKNQLKILEELKTTNGIDNVYNRVYEGNRGFNLMPKF